MSKPRSSNRRPPGVKEYRNRLSRAEREVVEDDPAAGDPADLGSPSDYRLIVCRIVIPEQEPVEAALARWQLVRADIPAGVFVYLAPCGDRHDHRPPVLLCHRPQGPSTDHERLLTAALALSEEERAQQRQARWARDRETLWTLKEQQQAAL
jgi:hypothetical protein